MNDERDVRDFLAGALNSEEPEQKARSIVTNLPSLRPRPWRIAALAAACLLLLLPVVSVRMPVMARALIQIPLVGDAYARFLQDSGMDIAYQAGLVTELNKSIVENDVTLTILSAYSDAAQGVIFFSLSSQDTDKMDAIWSGFLEIEMLRRGRRSFGMLRSSTYEYLVDDNAIVGVINTAPISGLFGSRISLRLSSQALSTVWEVDFPVQTVSSSLNEAVPVNKHFVYEGDKFEVQSVMFTPSRTLVKYSQVFGPENTQDGPPIDKKSGGLKHTSSTWSLETSDGTKLSSYGSSFSSDGKTGSGELYFAPTFNKNLVLYFEGTTVSFEHAATIDLKPGSRVETSQGDLLVGNIDVAEDISKVQVAWESPSILKKLDAAIIDSRGNKAKITAWEEGQDQVTLVFEQGPIFQPLMLEITMFHVHYEARIIAAEIKP